jgi:TldD protein
VSEDDPILEAMAAELRRSRQGLRVPGSPRPYYMSYVLRRRRELLLEAAYGSLLRRRDREQGSLHVDVRVGSHEFDNVIDGGLGGDDTQRESADWLTAPDDLDPIALRYSLWKLTQIKFDEALEDYYDHRKAMVAEYLRDEVASFTREPPIRHLEPIEEFDRTQSLPIERWSSELVELSRRLLEHPDIHDPGLSIHGERVHRWFVDSDGSIVRSSDLWLEFEVRGWVLTDDGVYVEASRSWPARSVAEMLDAPTMAVLFDEVVAELAQLREAESPGSFIGPALLMGQAASTMFHEALGHRLEGNRLVARGETRTFAHMLGERILPPGLHVFDDPTITQAAGRSLWGSYRVDDEGVSAHRAELVRDGILVGFLRNRAPLPVQPESATPPSGRSNGHGRTAGVERSMARMGNLIVESDAAHHQTQAALEAKLVALAREQGRRHAALIHRVRAGETATDSYDFQVFKGELAWVELLDVETGARRRVRDLELIGTPLSALQRIVAFGGEAGVDHGYCFAESGSIPVAGVAPAIVLSEVELQQGSRAGFHEPLLPPPFADDGSGGRTGRLRERGRRRRRPAT